MKPTLTACITPGAVAVPREELHQLSKSELIEIILRQQALIEQLQARVAQLEEQIKLLSDC